MHILVLTLINSIFNLLDFKFNWKFSLKISKIIFLLQPPFSTGFQKYLTKFFHKIGQKGRLFQSLIKFSFNFKFLGKVHWDIDYKDSSFWYSTQHTDRIKFIQTRWTKELLHRRPLIWERSFEKTTFWGNNLHVHKPILMIDEIKSILWIALYHIKSI